MITYELMIDIAIIVLLIRTIIYLYKLNKNLSILKKNQESLGQLVNSLNDAASKAENTIPQLKTATAHSAEELAGAAEKASKTKEEIEFLIDRAENLAGRLENVIYASRYQNDKNQNDKIEPAAAVSAKPEINFPELDDNHSEAEIELLQALRSIK